MPKLIQHNISNSPTNTDKSFLSQIRSGVYVSDEPSGGKASDFRLSSRTHRVWTDCTRSVFSINPVLQISPQTKRKGKPQQNISHTCLILHEKGDQSWFLRVFCHFLHGGKLAYFPWRTRCVNAHRAVCVSVCILQWLTVSAAKCLTEHYLYGVKPHAQMNTHNKSNKERQVLGRVSQWRQKLV